MGKSNFIIISESGTAYRKGTVLKDFQNSKNGVIFEGNLIPNGTYIKLNEKLSSDDERQVKELIRNQIKFLFWNLYTKQSMLVGS